MCCVRWRYDFSKVDTAVKRPWVSVARVAEQQIPVPYTCEEVSLEATTVMATLSSRCVPRRFRGANSSELGRCSRTLSYSSISRTSAALTGANLAAQNLAIFSGSVTCRKERFVTSVALLPNVNHPFGPEDALYQ